MYVAQPNHNLLTTLYKRCVFPGQPPRSGSQSRPPVGNGGSIGTGSSNQGNSVVPSSQLAAAGAPSGRLQHQTRNRQQQNGTARNCSLQASQTRPNTGGRPQGGRGGYRNAPYSSIVSSGQQTLFGTRQTQSWKNGHGGHPRVDGDGFMTQRTQWKNGNRKMNANDDIHIFIGNVDKSNDVEHVYDHLSKMGVTIRGLYQRSNVTAMRKAFVCIVSFKDSKKILDESKWPSGIEVREYDLIK